MREGGARGEGGIGEGGVDVVVGEREECEVREAAEGIRKGPDEPEVAEVDSNDGIAGAGDAGPVAGRGVAGVPVGQRIGGVFQPCFGVQKQAAFMVQARAETEELQPNNNNSGTSKNCHGHESN